MHIAIDVRSLMEGRHSGVEEYTTQIIRAMSEYAPLHTYHVFYNSARAVTLPSFRDNVVVHSFSYPNKILNASQLVFGLPKWDRMMRTLIDVVFIPNPRLVPLSAGIPFVTVAHDVSYERFPEFLTLKRRMWHALMQPKKLLEKSHHIIAVSEHTKRDLTDVYDIDPNAVRVVYPGVAPTPASVNAVQVQQVILQYRLPQSFLLFVGTREPRKNITSVIEAFSSIANHISQDLVIAGEVGWKEAEIMHAISSSPYSDRIHFIGFVREEDKRAIYAAADVFVYPSFYEGFGFPPLEALMAGTPTVTSFNSSLPEVVGKWATLVDPYNTPEIASVLKELLVSPMRVEKSVQEEIIKQYSWERAAKETVEVLESVV